MQDTKEVLEYKDLLKKFDLVDEFYPLIYVSSPYRENAEDAIKKAREYSRFTFEKKNIPITPHLLFPQFVNYNDPFERNIAIHKICYVLLGLCSEVWVFGNEITDEMKKEISIAEKRQKTIKYFNQNLKEV